MVDGPDGPDTVFVSVPKMPIKAAFGNDVKMPMTIPLPEGSGVRHIIERTIQPETTG